MAAPVNTSAVTILAAGRQWVVESRSNPGTLHVVRKTRSGDLSCTCSAALNGMRCWHTASVAALDRPAVDQSRIDAARAIGLMAPAKA